MWQRRCPSLWDSASAWPQGAAHTRRRVLRDCQLCGRSSRVGPALPGAPGAVVSAATEGSWGLLARLPEKAAPRTLRHQAPRLLLVMPGSGPEPRTRGPAPSCLALAQPPGHLPWAHLAQAPAAGLGAPGRSPTPQCELPSRLRFRVRQRPGWDLSPAWGLRAARSACPRGTGGHCGPLLVPLAGRFPGGGGHGRVPGLAPVRPRGPPAPLPARSR